MKKAEEYIDISKISYKSKTLQISVIEKWIKQAQIESINYTIKRCVEEAKLDKEVVRSNSHCVDQGARYVEESTVVWNIDKQSILDVADKIKEEL